MLWARQDFAARSCCDPDLQCTTQNVMATRRLNMVFIFVKYFKIRQITKSWAGHDFAYCTH